MNFLAHIYLSGEDPQLQLGNFAADSIKGKKYLDYPEGFKNGILVHRAIDSYTDSHPIVRQSISRLFPKYRHYSGVIVDILYDHYLAANWNNYSDIPLATYCQNFYELLEQNFDVLPTKVQNFMPYMIQNNWLLSYATIPGIATILDQMNHRTKNVSKMSFAVVELEQYYKEFEEEFTNFFPNLELHVFNTIRALNKKIEI